MFPRTRPFHTLAEKGRKAEDGLWGRQMMVLWWLLVALGGSLGCCTLRGGWWWKTPPSALSPATGIYQLPYPASQSGKAREGLGKHKVNTGEVDALTQWGQHMVTQEEAQKGERFPPLNNMRAFPLPLFLSPLTPLSSS